MPAIRAASQCNSRGLTSLGRYLIQRMIADHMLIEVDHLTERARDTVLAIAAKAHYPLISSHNGTGGEWTPAELRTALPARRLRRRHARTSRPHWPRRSRPWPRYDKPAVASSAIGLGTDTNGFSSLPGPRADARPHPLRYPFTSYDGSVTFTRERTGHAHVRPQHATAWPSTGWSPT